MNIIYLFVSFILNNKNLKIKSKQEKNDTK